MCTSRDFRLERQIGQLSGTLVLASGDWAVGLIVALALHILVIIFTV